MRRSTLAFLVAVTLCGCGRTGTGEGARTGLDGSGPSGSLRVAVAAPLASIVERQGARFERLYPEAEVSVTPTTTREALVALVAGGADAAVTDRAMNAEERRAAEAAGLDVAEVELGDGALVVAAADGGPTQLSLEALASALAGEGPYPLALTSRNAGTVELLGDRLLDGRPPTPSFQPPDEPGVLAWVAERRGALGVVSLSTWARADSATTRRLRPVALPDSTGAPVRPSPMSVYRGQYPLVQPLYLYAPAGRSPLTALFATFAVGIYGQEEIQRGGLVPATLPAREVILE